MTVWCVSLCMNDITSHVLIILSSSPLEHSCLPWVVCSRISIPAFPRFLKQQTWYSSTKDITDEGKFYPFFRLLLALIVKVFAFFHIVYVQQETRVDNPLPPAEPEPIFDDHPAVETFSLDHISPVIKRLQRLEGKVDELGSKPPEIPLEKERSLLESWDRIKCIESDLERTKKVSFH